MQSHRGTQLPPVSLRRSSSGGLPPPSPSTDPPPLPIPTLARITRSEASLTHRRLLLPPCLRLSLLAHIRRPKSAAAAAAVFAAVRARLAFGRVLPLSSPSHSPSSAGQQRRSRRALASLYPYLSHAQAQPVTTSSSTPPPLKSRPLSSDSGRQQQLTNATVAALTQLSDDSTPTRP